MELYGLVSIIDPQVFGDERSFREQFADAAANPTSQERLRDRLKPLCMRTLRKQVLEYVRFTERHCITRAFFPSDRRARPLRARLRLPSARRACRHPRRSAPTHHARLAQILASSTFAIANTLEGMANRLEEALKAHHEPHSRRANRSP